MLMSNDNDIIIYCYYKIYDGNKFTTKFIDEYNISWIEDTNNENSK